MENKHHYFFAVKLPKEVKTFLNEWVQSHKEGYPFARWVHPEDYHITLAFLGFAEARMIQDAVKTMDNTLAKQRPFSLTLNKLGTFGPVKSPRIFWADVHQSDQLMQIQKEVYGQCISLGFELDKKPFSPHITLARKWKSEKPFEKEKLIDLKTTEGRGFEFQVNEIVLYETHLDKTPKYNEFASFPLTTE